MKQVIETLIREARYKLLEMKKGDMTLKDRIALEVALEKLELARTLNQKFANT